MTIIGDVTKIARQFFTGGIKMSCIWISAQECSRRELLRLTELVRQDSGLKVIVSNKPPYPGGCQETSGNENSDLLIRLGVRANLKGFAYLKTAVKICRKDRGELDGITKRLYPSIAKIYGTSADKVEQSIRHAIRTLWDKGGNEEQRHVFGYCCGEGKRPTNAEFIGHVADHLDQMEKMLFS